MCPNIKELTAAGIIGKRKNMLDSESYACISMVIIPVIAIFLAEKYFKIFSSVVRSCVFLGVFFIFANVYTLFSVYIKRRYFGEIRDLYVFEHFGWLLMSAFPILATVFFNLIRFICNLLTNPRRGIFAIAFSVCDDGGAVSKFSANSPFGYLEFGENSVSVGVRIIRKFAKFKAPYSELYIERVRRSGRVVFLRIMRRGASKYLSICAFPHTGFLEKIEGEFAERGVEVCDYIQPKLL